MSTAIAPTKTAKNSEVAELFEMKSPILVEVRFTNMGTAPDWYLFHEMDELESLLNRLGPGAVPHLHSVWELKNTGQSLLIRKA